MVASQWVPPAALTAQRPPAHAACSARGRQHATSSLGASGHPTQHAVHAAASQRPQQPAACYPRGSQQASALGASGQPTQHAVHASASQRPQPTRARQPASQRTRHAASARSTLRAQKPAIARSRPTQHAARAAASQPTQPPDAACRHAAIPNGIRIGSSYKSCSPICNI